MQGAAVDLQGQAGEAPGQPPVPPAGAEPDGDLRHRGFQQGDEGQGLRRQPARPGFHRQVFGDVVREPQHLLRRRRDLGRRAFRQAGGLAEQSEARPLEFLRHQAEAAAAAFRLAARGIRRHPPPRAGGGRGGGRAARPGEERREQEAGKKKAGHGPGFYPSRP